MCPFISRLYDVDAGEVCVDGVNVKEYSLDNLRNGIGMVLQKNTLFSGDIYENLRWGNENADEKTIAQAAADAQADKFIRGFKKDIIHSLDKVVLMCRWTEAETLYCQSLIKAS